MEPLISVFMPTFNHGAFIEEAVEGVMKQETEYPLELIICDDFSTDGTREKADALAQKYGNIVLSFQPHNTSGVRNMMEGLARIRGKYVAMCEGDDYWSDPKKLQTQVSFLEANPEFTVSTHKVDIVYADRPLAGTFAQNVYKDCSADEERIRQGIFFADEVVDNYYMHTSSMVFRWKFKNGLPDSFRVHMLLDHFLLLLHAAEGKIKYFDQSMSAWRRHVASYSYAQLHDKGLFFQKEGQNWLNCYREIDNYFHKRFHLQIRERMLLALRALTEYCVTSGQHEQIMDLYRENWDIINESVLKNEIIYNAIHTLLPADRKFSPPWASETSQPALRVASAPETSLKFLPESSASVLQMWTEGKAWSSFAGFRSAVAACCFFYGINTIWLPAVYSRKFVRAFMELQIACKFYPINDSFEIEPAFLKLVNSKEAVLTPNWFGRPVNKAFQDALAKMSGICWIDDRSWCLQAPATRANVTIYSAFNLAGAPDGAILVGADADKIAPRGNNSSMDLLLAGAKRDEQEFVNQLPPGSASDFTISLLKRLPAKPLIEQRKSNWNFLYQDFCNLALVREANPAFVPSSFPVSLPAGTLIAAFVGELAKKGVSVGRLWAASPNTSDCYAIDMEKRIALLPCGHHLDVARIAYLRECIGEVFGNANNCLEASKRSQPCKIS